MTPDNKAKGASKSRRNNITGSSMNHARITDGGPWDGEPKYEGSKASRRAQRETARRYFLKHGRWEKDVPIDPNKVYAPLILGSEWPPANKPSKSAAPSPTSSASPTPTSSPNTSFEASDEPNTSRDKDAEINRRPSWDNHVPEEGDEIFQKTSLQIAQEALNDRVDLIWPHNIEKCVTIGAFTESGTPFTKPMEAQTDSNLFAILGHADIGPILFGFLSINHSALAKMALTCRLGFGLVRRHMCFWDMDSALFDNCNNSVPEVEEVVKQDPENMPFMAPVHVIVARVRIPGKKLGLDRPDPVSQIKSLHTMCIATSNWSSQIRTFHLHRVQFLTTDVLRLLIPKLTNLEVLGVFKCPLIHLANGFELLDMIQTDRPKGKENKVGLDFYPNFHVGPDLKCNTQWTGSYGVTWDDTQFDTRLGVWAMARRMIDRARSQGQDFESPGTAFRKWLDDGPCWYVEDTLRDMMNPYYRDAELEVTRLMAIAPALRTQKFAGDLKKNQEIVAELAALFDAGNMDYDGSGTATSFRVKIGNRPHTWHLFTETGNCSICRAPLLKLFFPYLCRPGNEFNIPAACYGCALQSWLSTETDHLKSEKRDAIQHWLREPGPNNTWGPWNVDDLPRALKNFTDRDVVSAVYRIVQLTRERQMNFSPFPFYDPEWTEIQEVRDPGTEMYFNRNQAPQITNKDRKKSKYDIADPTRRRAHGI